MGRKSAEQEFWKRIREGEVRRKDVVRRLAELAFGSVNDCVKLVLEEKPNLDELDLTLLSEVRRSDKGAVEVRFMDRMQILEQLAGIIGEGGGDMDSFLQALQGGEKDELSGVFTKAAAGADLVGAGRAGCGIRCHRL